MALETILVRTGPRLCGSRVAFTSLRLLYWDFVPLTTANHLQLIPDSQARKTERRESITKVNIEQ
jgi:hypothetical protein